MIVSALSGKTVNMRAEPNSSARVLQAVPIGAKVDVLETGYIWDKISYSGMEGYMMTKFLNITK